MGAGRQVRGRRSPAPRLLGRRVGLRILPSARARESRVTGHPLPLLTPEALLRGETWIPEIAPRGTGPALRVSRPAWLAGNRPPIRTRLFREVASPWPRY